MLNKHQQTTGVQAVGKTKKAEGKAQNRHWLDRVILAETDGATAANPNPDPWDAQRIIRIHNTIVLERNHTHGSTRRILETPRDVAAVEWLDNNDFDRILKEVDWAAGNRTFTDANRRAGPFGRPEPSTPARPAESGTHPVLGITWGGTSDQGRPMTGTGSAVPPSIRGENLPIVRTLL